MNKSPDEYRSRVYQATQMTKTAQNPVLDTYLRALNILGLCLSEVFHPNEDLKLYPNKKPYIWAESCHDRSKFDFIASERYFHICWMQTPNQRIHAAAVRGSTGFIIVGQDHYDLDMKEQISQRVDGHLFLSKMYRDLGFVDNHGIYHDRNDAFLIAQQAGQLKSDLTSGGKIKEDEFRGLHTSMLL